jgi:hypothetical protein
MGAEALIWSIFTLPTAKGTFLARLLTFGAYFLY